MKVLNEKKITLSGVPGRETLINDRKISQIHAKLYLVKNRMFIFEAEYPQGKSLPSNVNRFLNTLQLSLPAQK